MQNLDIIKVVWPVIVIQLIVQIYAIVDVVRRKKTKNLTPVFWIVIIILGELIGSVVYFLVGRSED